MFISTPTIIVHLMLVVVLITCCTRLLSGSYRRADNTGKDGTKIVPVIPFWITFFGHIFSYLTSPKDFLNRCSHKAASAVFSVNMLGFKTKFVSTIDLINAVILQDSSLVDYAASHWYCLTNFFGAERSFQNAYLDVHEEINISLSKGPLVNALLPHTLTSMQEHIPNLVSFSSSVVDQSIWERNSFATTIKPYSTTTALEAVEVNLFSLVRTFVGSISVPSLMGSEFTELYPGVLEDIWDLEKGSYCLMLGLPRWLTVPSLTKARIARLRLLRSIKAFHKALDWSSMGNQPELPWRNMDDVSDLVKARASVWRARGTPQEIIDPCGLSLLFSMTVDTATLVFWILVRIWVTPGLVEQVRDETAMLSKASQPVQGFGIPQPPRVKINGDEIARSCPLLRACYLECLRLYSMPISVLSVKHSFTITETPTGCSLGTKPRSFLMEEGDHVALPFTVHHFDPLVFPSPTNFQPGRFLKTNIENKSQQSLDVERLKLPANEQYLYQRLPYAEREILSFVSGILALWNFEAVDPNGWIVPEGKQSIGIALPSNEIRARLRRRQLP